MIKKYISTSKHLRKLTSLSEKDFWQLVETEPIKVFHSLKLQLKLNPNLKFKPYQSVCDYVKKV